MAADLNPPQIPPVFTATPESLAADTKRLIARSKKLQDDVVAQVTPEKATFSNVILPMAQDDDMMSTEAQIIGFYQAVSTDSNLRNASTDAEKEMDDFSIESSMREDVFKLVQAVLDKKEQLDPESQRLLEKTHKAYVKMGLGLPAGEKRDRFKAIKKRLSELAISFQRNLNEEQGGLWFTEAELDGLSPDLLHSLEQGEGDNAGKRRLTFKYPDIIPALRLVHNADVRRKLYIANENKCNQNVELFKEAIQLRDEAARLLGFPNHAAFKVEDKMAKTTEYVDTFLGGLREKLKAAGQKDLQTLIAIKQKDMKSRGKSEDSKFYLWDNTYYNTLLLKQDYDLDNDLVSEWFPLQPTIQGMLQIFEEIFGLAFVEVVGQDRDKLSPTGKGTDLVWHPDVKLFSVWDDASEGSGFVGYLYLDLHPRDGKYGHAANFGLQPGFRQADGSKRYPCTSLVCNFSKPTAKKPSLLKHSEVTTLFHELGHGIHDLVARTTYSLFHGTSTVRDFVEAPSQMLENWCWEPAQLKALSKHYSYLSPEYKAAWLESAGEGGATAQPQEQMPADLVKALVRTRHVNDGLATLRQLFYGSYDMAVHEGKSAQAVRDMNVSQMFNEMRRQITQIDGPESQGEGAEWGNGEATFGHLMGGYDAGYYGYLSSQVYSADMYYSVFSKDPLDKKEGRRYRHTVLERGGSQDEMLTLTQFLGRKPSPEAFYRELGISA